MAMRRQSIEVGGTPSELGIRIAQEALPNIPYLGPIPRDSYGIGLEWGPDQSVSKAL